MHKLASRLRDWCRWIASCQRLGQHLSQGFQPCVLVRAIYLQRGEVMQYPSPSLEQRWLGWGIQFTEMVTMAFRRLCLVSFWSDVHCMSFFFNGWNGPIKCIDTTGDHSEPWFNVWSPREYTNKCTVFQQWVKPQGYCTGNNGHTHMDITECMLWKLGLWQYGKPYSWVPMHPKHEIDISCSEISRIRYVQSKVMRMATSMSHVHLIPIYQNIDWLWFYMGTAVIHYWRGTIQ